MPENDTAGGSAGVPAHEDAGEGRGGAGAWGNCPCACVPFWRSPPKETAPMADGGGAPHLSRDATRSCGAAPPRRRHIQAVRGSARDLPIAPLKPSRALAPEFGRVDTMADYSRMTKAQLTDLLNEKKINYSSG